MLPVGAHAQIIQIVYIIIKGIFSHIAKFIHAELESDPLVGMLPEKGHNPFKMLRTVIVLHQGAQGIIQVFLPRSGKRIIHPFKNLIHSQVIPGNVVNLTVPFMTQIIAPQLFKPFRGILLIGKLKVIFIQVPYKRFFSFFCAVCLQRKYYNHKQGNGRRHQNIFHNFSLLREPVSKTGPLILSSFMLPGKT